MPEISLPVVLWSALVALVLLMVGLGVLIVQFLRHLRQLQTLAASMNAVVAAVFKARPQPPLR